MPATETNLRTGKPSIYQQARSLYTYRSNISIDMYRSNISIERF
ncbi:MAG: hypothetical protein ACRC62_01230 [Microcoleus sp.]